MKSSTSLSPLLCVPTSLDLPTYAKSEEGKGTEGNFSCFFPGVLVRGKNRGSDHAAAATQRVVRRRRFSQGSEVEARICARDFGKGKKLSLASVFSLSIFRENAFLG